MSLRLEWKKLVIAGVVSSTVFIGSAQPAFAAENFFQKIQHSVSSGLDGFYLKYIPGNKPGKLVVKQMTDSYKNLKSFEDDTAVDVDVIGNGQTLGSAHLKMTGPMVVGEFSNPQSYQQDLKVAGQVSMQGTTLSATADLKMINGVSYLRITQLPGLPGTSFDQVKDKWIKFDPAATRSATKDTVKWTPEQQQKLQDGFFKMVESAKVSEAKPDKKDGVDVYVITLNVPKQAVVDYVMTLSDTQLQAGAMIAPTKDPAESRKNLETAMDAVGDVNLTLWVERNHYYPKHFELPLELDVKKILTAQESSTGKAMMPVAQQVDKVNLKIVSDISKFNESFTVTAPDSAEDAQTFFQKVMGPAMMGGAAQVPSDTSMMGVNPGIVSPTSYPTGRMPLYRPSVGSSELPQMTDQQKKQLELYQQQTGNKLPPMNY